MIRILKSLILLLVGGIIALVFLCESPTEEGQDLEDALRKTEKDLEESVHEKIEEVRK